jgi:hypothetical protein
MQRLPWFACNNLQDTNTTKDRRCNVLVNHQSIENVKEETIMHKKIIVENEDDVLRANKIRTNLNKSLQILYIRIYLIHVKKIKLNKYEQNKEIFKHILLLIIIKLLIIK